MTDLLKWALTLLGGFGVGIVFFGGLWLTVRRFDKMKHPGLVILLSSVGRIGLVLVAFWWLSRGSLLPLAIALAGFLAARFIIIRTVGNRTPTESPPSSAGRKPCT